MKKSKVLIVSPKDQVHLNNKAIINTCCMCHLCKYLTLSIIEATFHEIKRSLSDWKCIFRLDFKDILETQTGGNLINYETIRDGKVHLFWNDYRF